LDINELQTALPLAGMAVSPTLLMSLMRKFDASRTAQLDFEGFLALTAHVTHMFAMFQQSSGGAPTSTTH
jgi:Ca2+-binding EF-hand superfamily protein